MDNFIYQNVFSITPELCKDIINMFESEKNKRVGNIARGVNKDVKDTTDFNIPKCTDESHKWYKTEKFLYKELNKNLLLYIKQINSNNYQPESNNAIDGSIFTNKTMKLENFMIQKYEKNKGKYTYHNDFAVDSLSGDYRVITYIWYLNTVDIGGETEFWDTYKIKPVAGKLVLFPATWTYHHRGLMPISDNKYIITGWFYI